MKGARRHANRMICETLDALRVLLAPRTRLLGLDVGAKTIGLALSDVTRMVATPMDLIRRKKLTAISRHCGALSPSTVSAGW